MEIVDLVPLIELLDDNIDDLEEALEPLLKSALLDTAGKLPLLEKAQLYVLVTYTIESVLFCKSAETRKCLRLTVTAYLRLNGVNSKEHPVFRELTRVKQYFEKIKAAESVVTKQNVTLDKAAAGRFIKHSLVGIDCYAIKYPGADFNIRLETRILISIWAEKVERKAEPPIQDLKNFQESRSATAPRTGQEPFPQVTISTLTWTIRKVIMDKVRRE